MIKTGDYGLNRRSVYGVRPANESVFSRCSENSGGKALSSLISCCVIQRDTSNRGQSAPPCSSITDNHPPPSALISPLPLPLAPS